MGQTLSHTSSSVYSRDESPTQDKATALLQVSSGEVWGRAAQQGAFPCVKAYRRAQAGRGIEFTTNHVPTPGYGSILEARWAYCLPGMLRCTPTVTLNAGGYAVITVTSIRNLQP
jgi:hypothetical protein